MIRLVMGFAALALVSGCGIPGELERPDPIWGSEQAIARECARQLERGETRDPRCAQRQQQPQ